MGSGVDYSCAIGGILCGVSVTRSHITRLSHLEEKSDADGGLICTLVVSEAAGCSDRLH